MKLIHIAKLNTFVYAMGTNAFLDDHEREQIRDYIQDELSGIEPEPHVIVFNGEFNVADDSHSRDSIHKIKRMLSHATKAL